MTRTGASCLLGALVVVACLVVRPHVARAQTWQQSGAEPTANVKPEALEGVDVVEHLGNALPRDAVFHDSDGKTVHLGDYFDGKRPTLLVFAYHTCPMLCSLVLDATVKALDDVAWTVGDQFDVVSISIDPKDTPETAAKKRAQVVDGYRRASGDSKGWHFLTGEEREIRKVTDAIGFEYRYDPRQKQYAHPAAIYLLTPDGHIARYLYGIQYDPNDVRLGLLEASQGRSVSTTERVLLFCYHFDPKGGHYTLVALNVMRVGGGATLALLGGLLTVVYIRDRRKRRGAAARPEMPAAHAKELTSGR